jgi:hypothetical protein
MKKLISIAKIATATTAATLGALSITSAASAGTLVPQKEGEIALKNNTYTCLSDANCIDTRHAGFSIESLGYNGKTPSLLFSDKRDTANSYTKNGVGINFFGETGVPKFDEGTNTPLGEFWLRPVALDSLGKPLEDGRLEVGKFKFDFLGKTKSEVVLSLFDVEYKNSTKVSFIVNGKKKTFTAAAGADGNTQQITLKNVKNFEIQLGQQGGKFGTGDGVSLQATAVPESSVNASFGALGLAAMFGLNRRRNSKAVKFN